MITAGLATYNNSDVIALQLESLCKQKTYIDWELIVCEEQSDKYFGAENLKKWKARLNKVGCKSIKFIELSEWIPLSKKWLLISKEMNPKSVGMMLCASDNYSPPYRVEQSYEALTAGYDWVQWLSGHFYNVLDNTCATFNGSVNKPALFMAVAPSVFESLDTYHFPKKGVDTWLHKKSKKRLNNTFADGGLHTDGMNTISHNRRLLYDGGGLFSKCELSELDQDILKHFSKDVDYYNKSLKELRKLFPNIKATSVKKFLEQI